MSANSAAWGDSYFFNYLGDTDTEKQADILKKSGMELEPNWFEKRILKKVLTKHGVCNKNFLDDPEVVFKFEHILNDFLKASTDIPKRCLNPFFEAYVLQKYKSPNPLTDSYCDTHECSLIKAVISKRDENIALLNQGNALSFDFGLSCGSQNLTKAPDANVKKFFRELKEINSCRILDIGESRKIDSLSLSMPQTYNIKRTSDKEYRIRLNLDFVDTSFKNRDGSTTISTHLMAQIKSCTKKYKNRLKDSSGRTLNLEVLTPRENNKLSNNERAPAKKIYLADNSLAANSITYNNSMNCETIIHELFHLVGLVDEYNIPELRSVYHCRPKVNTNSIMKGFSDLLPRTKNKKATSCECNEDSSGASECLVLATNLSTAAKKAYLKSQARLVYMNPDLKYGNGLSWYASMNICSVKRELVPVENEADLKGFQVFSWIDKDKMSFVLKSLVLVGEERNTLKVRREEYSCSCSGNAKNCEDLRDTLNRLRNQYIENEALNECPYFSKTILTENPSLSRGQFSVPRDEIPAVLQMSHVDRIINGDCALKNKKYNTCSQYTYEKDTNKCKNIPSYCLSEEWLQGDGR